MFRKANFRKTIALCLSVLLLAGCAGQEKDGLKEELSAASLEVLPQRTRAVVSWEESGISMQDNCFLAGDTLYCADRSWDNEKNQRGNISIRKKGRGMAELEEVLVLEGGAELIAYFPDESEAVYCLYGREESGDLSYGLKKVSLEGACVYDRVVSSEDGSAFEHLETVFAGAADREGRVCLADARGDLFFFDGTGRCVGTGKAPWDEKSCQGGSCGLAATGESGIFAYRTEGREVKLWKVDMEEGCLREGAVLRPDGQESLSGASLAVYSGYGCGILLADSDALWKYDPLGNVLTKVLGFRDSAVNLSGYTVGAVGVLPEESLYLLVYQDYSKTAFVQIDFREEEEEMERQAVTLAWLERDWSSSDTDALAEAAGAFNRINGEFQVEFESYPSVEALHMALVRGEGPDVIPDYGGDIRALAAKGALEDLAPYFSESETVGEGDLLPSVRGLGVIEGKWSCVFPAFQISGLKVGAGYTEGGAWTPEDYISLGESHPGAAMYDDFHPSRQDAGEYRDLILWVAISADLDSYIDWEKRECYFDGEEFISLLQRIEGLRVPDPSSDSLSGIDRNSGTSPIMQMIENMNEMFENGEILARGYVQGSVRADDSYGEPAGFPNRSGSPRYKLDPVLPALSINSASKNKEGAWAFLEYLLSKEYQSGLDSFPARRDVLEGKLALIGTLYGEKMTEKERADAREAVRGMADNLYWGSAVFPQDYSSVIYEEAGAVWSGDRTAREAAENIQNRISMSLSEG